MSSAHIISTSHQIAPAHSPPNPLRFSTLSRPRAKLLVQLGSVVHDCDTTVTQWLHDGDTTAARRLHDCYLLVELSEAALVLHQLGATGHVVEPPLQRGNGPSFLPPPAASYGCHNREGGGSAANWL